MVAMFSVYPRFRDPYHRNVTKILSHMKTIMPKLEEKHLQKGLFLARTISENALIVNFSNKNGQK